MPVRHAACDPCRVSKVACDHSRPVCRRCRDNARSSKCSYRARPFKKRRTLSSKLPSPSIHDPVDKETGTPPVESVQTAHIYPNPGYLGTGSHTTVFEQLTVANDEVINDSPATTSSGYPVRAEALQSALQTRQGATLIEDIRTSLPILLCVEAVKKWLAKGVNLATAGPITLASTIAAGSLLLNDRICAAELSKTLYLHTCQSLIVDISTCPDEYCSQFCGHNTRWETIGLFLIVLGHAFAEDLGAESQFRTRSQRQQLRNQALRLADQCLENALSMDCLNDLQLVLQYENWIAHSLIDGDQSYYSWRKLGDVMSSIFALGYHEDIGNMSNCPAFLIHLRSVAVARTYSADKNVSLFLGRPPRMHRSYCKLDHLINQLALSRIELANIPGQRPANQAVDTFDYSLDTQWAASCAVLKERVLDIPRKNNVVYENHLSRDIIAEAERLWLTLPPKYGKTAMLRRCEDLTAIELDFVISTRLNFLHIFFLLRRSSSQNVLEPNMEWVGVAAEMLHLAATAVILQDYLLNSGTSLSWKIAYYGLSAAGIACLSLLNRGSAFGNSSNNVQQVIQDLSVLVAHSDSGVLIAVDEPNYALVNRALCTIKSLIGRVLSPGQKDSSDINQISLAHTVAAASDFEDWIHKTNDQTAWEFELDFWAHLADHPELTDQLVGTG